jgi:hypothetical protein
LVVVFVPSLCCVVVLLLDCPVEGFEVQVLLLDSPFDGSDIIVLLLFCPSGFSVVVVLKLVWANPALPRAKLSPMAAAAIFSKAWCSSSRVVFINTHGLSDHRSPDAVLRPAADPKATPVATRALEHRQSRYLNNRTENSHRPTRRCERQMQRFKSPRQAQAFLSAHAFIHDHFHPHPHQLEATTYRTTRTKAFNLAAGDLHSIRVVIGAGHRLCRARTDEG